MQQVVAQNRRKKLGSSTVKDSSVLAGKVYDDFGNIMGPKYSNTRKKMYRYYVSRAITEGFHHKAGSLPNIPAEQLESLVRNMIARFLRSKVQLQKHLKDFELDHQLLVLKRAQNYMDGDVGKERLLIRYATHRVEVADNYVKVDLCRDCLVQALGNDIRKKPRDYKPEKTIRPEKEIELAATNNGEKVVVGNVSTGRNEVLIKAIARSFHWNDQLIKGERKSYQDIANNEKISSPSYVGRVVRLRFLSPQIIEMILDGNHPQEWTVEKLFAIKETDWMEQGRMLRLS